MKVVAFVGAVAAFTYYGYGRARQEFVREKLKIVDQYSISSTTKWIKFETKNHELNIKFRLVSEKVM